MLRNSGLFRGQSPIGRIYVLDGDYWLLGENNEVRQLHDETLAQTIERLLDAQRVPA
jgi:aminoglycoside N3'-acetyltransferase